MIPSSKPQISVTQRIDLLESANNRRSDAGVRLELALLYQSVARAEDAAKILVAEMEDPEREFRRRMLLANIWMMKDDPVKAGAMLDDILSDTSDQRDLSNWRSLMGKCLLKQDSVDSARKQLLLALSINPANSLAYSRYAELEIAENRPEAVLAVATEEKYLEHPCSGLLSARQRGLFHSGRQKDAIEISGCENSIFHDRLECPDGWETTADFNNQLAKELGRHPDIYHPASTGNGMDRLRSNGLHFSGAPACAALSSAIRFHVGQFVDGLDHSQVWMKGKPDRAKIDSWSMRTRRGGYDAWHYHASGWLSGVYYVQSEASRQAGKDGSIGFAPVSDDHHVRCRIAPEPGEILLFPSQLYHRTYPAESDNWRISVAFDIVSNRRQPF